jgi:hypothetical protein
MRVQRNQIFQEESRARREYSGRRLASRFERCVQLLTEITGQVGNYAQFLGHR